MPHSLLVTAIAERKSRLRGPPSDPRTLWPTSIKHQHDHSDAWKPTPTQQQPATPVLRPNTKTTRTRVKPGPGFQPNPHEKCELAYLP